METKYYLQTGHAELKNTCTIISSSRGTDNVIVFCSGSGSIESGSGSRCGSNGSRCGSISSGSGSNGSRHGNNGSCVTCSNPTM